MTARGPADHDLVVIGGGIAGCLAALTAASRGLDFAWIADPIDGAAQSAQWHAHMHRGRLYDPERESELIAELELDAAFWWSDPVRAFHAPVRTMAIGTDRGWAAQFRTRVAGGGTLTRPSFLRPGALAVRTDEAILRGPEFLLAASGVARRLGNRIDERAVALGRGSRGWTVRTASGREVRARSVILATGIAIDDLLPTGLRVDRPHTVRLSRMLVLRGRLPRAAAIVPSRASGGLFFASREVPGPSQERVWLVSDGFNTPGSASPSRLTDGWWACSVIERLTEVVRPDLIDTTMAAAYRAAKSRLAASPTQVPARGVGVDAHARVVALTPSKWSAAPTSAIDALDALDPDPLPVRDRLAGLAGLLTDAPWPTRVFTERWAELDPAVPTRELRRPGIAALEAAAALFDHEERTPARDLLPAV